MQYVLFNVPNLGFLQESMDALVDGITEAIRRAHVSLVPGSIYLRLESTFICSAGIYLSQVRRAHVSVVPGSIYLRLGEHMYP